MMELGEYIRSERTKHGSVSLRLFAKTVGISASYMSDVELGRRKASKEMVQRIARALFITVPGDHYERYEKMLSKAGLLTPERQCLLELQAASKIGGIIDLHSSTKQKIYEALYGELNEIILYGIEEKSNDE